MHHIVTWALSEEIAHLRLAPSILSRRFYADSDSFQARSCGFRNIDNFRLQILLAGGTNPLRETHTVTSIRPRRPRLVA